MATFKIILTTILLIPVLVIAWALVEPYFIDEVEHSASVPALPAAWEGARVALIADMQVGMWMDNIWTIERIVDRIVEERPAVVLVAGDFVYHPDDTFDEARHAARLLEPIADAGIPVFAVLGNHDYAMPTMDADENEALAAAVRSALEDVGIRVMENEALALPSPSGSADDPLYLVGVGAHVPGNDDPEAALAELPAEAPRIVMMHNPNSFEAFPEGSAPFAVAAHTHGGQFRIPFTPNSTWMTYTEENEVHADGWISDYGLSGNRLYVNRGIGFSVVPLRLNCPPELTWFTLRTDSV